MNHLLRHALMPLLWAAALGLVLIAPTGPASAASRTTDVDDARRQWKATFSRDRADLGPTVAAQPVTWAAGSRQMPISSRSS